MKLQPIPDEIFEFFGENWNTLGYNSIFIFRLLEMGLTYEVIDEALSVVVGKNYKDISCTNWIYSMECKGIDCSDDKDEPPFREVLYRIITTYELTGEIKTGDFYIKNYNEINYNYSDIEND